MAGYFRSAHENKYYISVGFTNYTDLAPCHRPTTAITEVRILGTATMRNWSAYIDITIQDWWTADG